MRDLESKVEALEVDWETLHERVLTNLRRTRQMHAKLDAAETSQPGEETAHQPEGMSQGRLLSPRQMEIQQQILRRRAGG